MPRFSTDAIILNTIDYLESDKIICALSRDRGVINAIAKGAKRSKRRFPGTLEPFSEVSLLVFSRPGMDLLRIESADLIRANLDIRTDIDLFAHASVLVENVINHLGPLDPSPETYICLSWALETMNPRSRWFSVWCIALVRILGILGYGIDVKDLQKKAPFHTNKGPQRERLSNEALMFLAKGLDLENQVLAKLSISSQARAELEAYLLWLCNHIADKPLKSIGFLAKLLDVNQNR